MPLNFPDEPSSPSSAIPPRRVLIVDDHPVASAGLALILEKSGRYRVYGQCGVLEDAIALASETRPDLVILDLDLGSESGLGFLQAIRPLFPSLPVIIWSVHDETVFAERVLKAGANGFLSKRESPEGILRVLGAVRNGEIVLRPESKNRVPDGFAGGRPGDKSDRVTALTNRELEIFGMLGRGMTTRGIAEALGLSVKTVEAHLAHMKSKLGCSSGRELNRLSFHWQIHGTFPEDWTPESKPAPASHSGPIAQASRPGSHSPGGSKGDERTGTEAGRAEAVSSTA